MSSTPLENGLDSWFPTTLDQVKDNQVAALMKASLEARTMAYAPYSKFLVGAAVLTSDGEIVQGCNVENASYGLGVCAEVTGVSKAVSEGMKTIDAVAVAADAPPGQFTSPCGRCRQFIAEFATDLNIKIYMIRASDNIYCESKLSTLLPMAFTPRTLKEATEKYSTK